MRNWFTIGCIIAMVAGSLAEVQAQQIQSILFSKKKKYQYRYVDTQQMIKRHIVKSHHALESIEGLYSVSGSVTKKGKGLLSPEVKERVVDRKDNYANIAIIRDWKDSESEFLVVSMSRDNAQQYPVVGELTTLSEGRGFLCKHFEPDGKVMTFTFTFDGDSNLLEGTFTQLEGKNTITYSLTYLKTYPKAEEGRD